MTIYMFLWIAQVIAAVPWKLISNFTYAREMMNDQGKQFAWFIVALVLLVVIENVLLFLEIFISEKIYIRTLDVLKNISSDDFCRFEKLCSLQIQGWILRDDFHSKYELSYMDKIILGEHGLINMHLSENTIRLFT